MRTLASMSGPWISWSIVNNVQQNRMRIACESFSCYQSQGPTIVDDHNNKLQDIYWNQILVAVVGQVPQGSPDNLVGEMYVPPEFHFHWVSSPGIQTCVSKSGSERSSFDQKCDWGLPCDARVSFQSLLKEINFFSHWRKYVVLKFAMMYFPRSFFNRKEYDLQMTGFQGLFFDLLSPLVYALEIPNIHWKYLF